MGQPSKVEIANMALFHLGVSSKIANLETEKSTFVTTVNTFYDNVLDEVLRDFNWPFATKYLTLAKIQDDPNDEWGYEYSYPTDCVKLRRIISGARNDDLSSVVPYTLQNDSNGNTTILIGIDEAQAVYTFRNTNVVRYPADFRSALSFKLAMYIAPSVTKGDPFKLSERAAQFYQFTISRAGVNAGNEIKDDPKPESDLVLARE